MGSESRVKLSATTLNIYRDCPRCFWLALNKNVPRPRGPMPSITIGMDSLLKKYFNIYRNKGTLPPFLEGKLPAHLIKSLPQALFFNPPDRNALLWGKLDDCLMFDDNTFSPFDHKTKGSAPKDVHHAFRFQMDVYTLLLLESGYKVRNTAYLAYYFPSEPLTDSGFDFGVEVRAVETDPENARRVFYEALGVLGGPLPESSPECEYCRYVDAVKTSV